MTQTTPVSELPTERGGADGYRSRSVQAGHADAGCHVDDGCHTGAPDYSASERRGGVS
jgi:hypothetical protein